MKLPAVLNTTLQALGLRAPAATDYDLTLLRKSLAGTDSLGRLNPTGAYQYTGGQLTYLDPEHQKIRARLVGQVGQVNSFFARKAAALPWGLWQDGSSGKPERLPPNHPLLELLWKPNAMTSFGLFMRQISTLYHADGNVYVWANRLESGPRQGQPTELWLLPAAFVTPIGGGHMEPVTAFRYCPNPAKAHDYEDLPVTDVLHLRHDPLPGERLGTGTIASAYREATTDKSTSDAANSLLQNQGPPGLLSFPPAGDTAITLSAPTLTDIRQRFDTRYSGPNNRGRIPIVSEKVEYVSTGATAVDLQLLEARKANLRELCAWWGFSAVLLGDMEASTDNNYKNARLALYTDAVLPYLETVTAEFSRWLPALFGIPGAWLEADTSRVQELQADKKTETERIMSMWLLPIERRVEMLGETVDKNFTGYLIPAGLVHITSTAQLNDEGQKRLREFNEYGGEDTGG